MKNFFLYVVVFVGGAAVLSIEILGTRILGPFYGVDIFLWSALISVTLSALSVGYIVGGNRADKGATLSKVCVSMAIAGFWTIAIPWLKYPLLALCEPMGLRAAVLVVAFILFFPPLALLGMICPLVIKLKTADLQEVGRTTGRLFAVSTIASVVSALLTGFFLVPNFGVTRLTLAVGCLLLATAGVGYFLDKRPGKSAGLALLALAALSAAGGNAGERADPASGLLDIEQSPYGELRVLQTDEGRHLIIDGAIHSLADPVTWESYLHYAAVMDIPKYFYDSTGSALLIGLGAGSLAKQYAHAGWSVDAVEIDPKVIRLAREYFGLKPIDGNVIEMDGRQYLSSCQKSYDVILLDAYGSSSIPFHLVTEEAFELMSKRLNRGGMLAVNAEANGWDDLLVKTLSATLKQTFKEVLALPMEEPPNRFGNMVLLASNRPLVPLREPDRNESLDPDWRFGPGYQKIHAWDNRFMPDIVHASVLTDDLNPIDILAGKTNLVGRKELHEYFKNVGKSW